MGTKEIIFIKLLVSANPQVTAFCGQPTVEPGVIRTPAAEVGPSHPLCSSCAADNGAALQRHGTRDWMAHRMVPRLNSINIDQIRAARHLMPTTTPDSSGLLSNHASGCPVDPSHFFATRSPGHDHTRLRVMGSSFVQLRSPVLTHFVRMAHRISNSSQVRHPSFLRSGTFLSSLSESSHEPNLPQG